LKIKIALHTVSISCGLQHSEEEHTARKEASHKGVASVMIASLENHRISVSTVLELSNFLTSLARARTMAPAPDVGLGKYDLSCLDFIMSDFLDFLGFCVAFGTKSTVIPSNGMQAEFALATAQVLAIFPA
jgi:hypothetical protein